MLAFYNGGEGAGASQTWRHLQAVEVPGNDGAPLEEWVEGMEVERKGASLIVFISSSVVVPTLTENSTDKPFVNTRLPHLHLMHHLPPPRNLPTTWTDESLDQMEMALAKSFVSLLDAMYDALRRNDAKDGGWNLLMTL